MMNGIPSTLLSPAGALDKPPKPKFGGKPRSPIRPSTKSSHSSFTLVLLNDPSSRHKQPLAISLNLAGNISDRNSLKMFEKEFNLSHGFASPVRLRSTQLYNGLLSPPPLTLEWQICRLVVPLGSNMHQDAKRNPEQLEGNVCATSSTMFSRAIPVVSYLLLATRVLLRQYLKSLETEKFGLYP
ncbi:hypothetical protein BDV96DRAFT_584378 [Lophiotrema nucula]|uniref:Uncharacterized protein n=1 Tax=Lophiotrema nucula TaxID=690887 RepID=A0A6A5YVD2_9PLEO|nr:hypothetical protein BDV96DRAFT_584378 [Lophiotrema nucula]